MLGIGILGLFSLLVLLPLGVVAWILGSKELRGMRAGTVDPSGRTVAQVGWVFGIVGTLLWIPLALLMLAFLWAVPGESTSTTSDSEHPGLQHVRVYYAPERSGNGPHDMQVLKLEYQERQQPNGDWAKDGPFEHLRRDGRKLEEGTYTAGKRTGTWTFWNEDGSVDHARSGVYENDVKARD